MMQKNREERDDDDDRRRSRRERENSLDPPLVDWGNGSSVLELFEKRVPGVAANLALRIIEAKSSCRSLAPNFEALSDEAVLCEGHLALVGKGGEDFGFFPADGAVASFSGMFGDARDVFVAFV